MRQNRSRLLRAACVLALLGAAWTARAQSEVDVQIFTPAPGRLAAITIAEPELPRHGTLVLGAAASWARWPLVRQADCSPTAVVIDSACVRGERDGRTPVVSDLAGLELSFAAALFETLQLGIVAPLYLARVADDFALPQHLQNRARFGDLRLHADVPLLRGSTALGFGFVASLPTGDGASLLGARNWSATPLLVLRQRLGAAALVAQLGYRLRERAVLLGLEQEDELDLGLGVALPIGHAFGLRGELRGRIGVGGRTQLENESPAEAALAGAWQPSSDSTLLLGAGAGVWPGRAGYGAPLFRVFALWRTTLETAPCRFGPEDEDGFADGDSCRDPDNDGDGVLDQADECPDDAEDRDRFADGDGCPDPDDDADGLADARDRCPRSSEDRDGFADEDGCPEPDNDEDGRPDGSDACSMDPEDRDGFEDDDGCPEPGPKPVSISVGEGRILVSERIYFDDDRDTIRDVSVPVLDQLAQVIRALGPGVKVVVEGHTDDAGSPAYNLDLSHRRARSVVEHLRARGVPAERLDSVGHGASQPLAPNDSPEGRALNRRVEFLLVR